MGSDPIFSEFVRPTPARRAPSNYAVTRYSDPRDHLPLTAPVFQILLSLVDRELHGYAIIADIRERTGGDVRLTASTLYAALRRLLDAGLLDEVDPPDRDADTRRRYYRLTKLGRDVGRLEAARLERLTAMAREKRLLPRLWPSPARKG
jgi:DNA-binding PadR family transcriptional regulator